MQAYETVLLTKTGLEDEERAAITERVQKIVADGGGKWDTIDDWGRKRLAYEIQKSPDAHFQVLYYDCDPATISEVRRVLSITDGVMRELSVKRVAPMPKELVEYIAAKEEADGERRDRKSKRGSGPGGPRDRGGRDDR